MKIKCHNETTRALGGGLALLGLLSIAGCNNSPSSEETATTKSALGNPGGAQACVVGTVSIRIAQRVTTAGGLATNSLQMESGSVANGGANINNAGGALVRISGAIINGTVRIAGPAPTAANGQLINGAQINGTILTGAAQQATLSTRTVTPGATAVTRNVGSPALTLAPGNYGAVTINGSTTTFTAGTYNLASLTVNGGTVNLSNGTGVSNVNVQGTIAVNGGAITAGNPGQVTLYSNSNSASAVTINAGIAALPATILAPNGGISVGSRVAVTGCVGGRTVNFEPDASVRAIETLTVPTNGNAVLSARSYSSQSVVNIQISGLIVWGGCDPVNCPDGASCNFIRLGDAQFHSDNCFTGSDPTFHSPTFDFPIQLFLNGAPLPATPFAPDHLYSFVVPGNNGPFAFAYNDIPGTFVDNSGSFTVSIFGD